MSDYQYDGAVTIKLSHDNDEITVWPSVEAPGSVTIALLDSEEPRTNIGIATPAEWDAFVAAGNAALGREATPPALATYFEEKAKVCDAGRAHGRATGNADLEACSKAEAATWRHAASLAVEASREAGPTVPRAAVEALASELSDAAQFNSEDHGERRAYANVLATLDFILGRTDAPSPKEPGHADD